MTYLSAGLETLGWRVTVGLVEGPRYHKPERYLSKHTFAQWALISCSTGTLEGRVRAINKLLRSIEPDVVVGVNIPDTNHAISRYRMGGKKASRVAMAIHGVEADLFQDIVQSNPVLDAVICTNRLACKLSEVKGEMPSSRVYYAPCGIEKRQSRANAIESQPLRIVWVGRLEQSQKRIYDLVNLVKVLDADGSDARFIVAGTGPEAVDVERELRYWINNGKVKLLGFVDPEKIWETVYDEADVLLVTSLWETGPIVIWEAMSVGMPVVSSRYIGSGLEDALIDEKNVLFFPIGDIEKAAQQIKRLESDPELGNKLASNGFELVSTRYSWTASVQAWHEALINVLSRPAKSLTVELRHPKKGKSRLDQYIGSYWGEYLRNWVGKSGPDSGPGGEWPHSYGTKQAGFLEFAANLDGIGIPEK